MNERNKKKYMAVGCVKEMAVGCVKEIACIPIVVLVLSLSLFAGPSWASTGSNSS
jgi:hypothetical protein